MIYQTRGNTLYLEDFNNLIYTSIFKIMCIKVIMHYKSVVYITSNGKVSHLAMCSTCEIFSLWHVNSCNLLGFFLHFRFGLKILLSLLWVYMIHGHAESTAIGNISYLIVKGDYEWSYVPMGQGHPYKRWVNSMHSMMQDLYGWCFVLYIIIHWLFFYE